MTAEAISSLSTLPPMIERYELKYVIPYSLVGRISRFIAPYCALDDHSTVYPDQFYPVNSLYFDTPNYRFLKQRMWGAERRFNMRVRTYGDGVEGPYFVEIKYKTPTSVKKFRAPLNTSDWPRFLTQRLNGACLADTACKETISRQLFLRLAEAYAIEPKIFTCYRRRAFFSRVDDYARVTFDIDMRYRAQDPLQAQEPYSLDPTYGCINYDAQTVYGDETPYNDNVVLELKATIGAVPLWMVELIRRFELKQVGFSKYLNSSLMEHSDNVSHYMSGVRRPVFAERWLSG